MSGVGGKKSRDGLVKTTLPLIPRFFLPGPLWLNKHGMQVLFPTSCPRGHTIKAHLVGSMREVQTSHIHSRLNHLLQCLHCLREAGPSSEKKKKKSLRKSLRVHYPKKVNTSSVLQFKELLITNVKCSQPTMFFPKPSQMYNCRILVEQSQNHKIFPRSLRCSQPVRTAMENTL